MKEEKKTGNYRTVFQTVSAEIEVKKSKFIAEIRHVESEEEAVALLKEFKKRYYDATHNCSAYVLRKDGGLRHSSDDGEPSGTAGKPMLDVILGEGLSDVLVVVTRYFGGTELGTGGLVRAYGGAVKELLQVADIVEIKKGRLVRLKLDYALQPKLTYLCKELGILIYETIYLEEVQISLLIEPELYGKFFKEISEQTAGVISEKFIENQKEVYYYMDKFSGVKLL